MAFSERSLNKPGAVALALVADDERTCGSGDGEVPAEFIRSLRLKQFTDLWVAERRRQLLESAEKGR